MAIKDTYLDFPIRSISDVYLFIHHVNTHGSLDMQTLKAVSRRVLKEAGMSVYSDFRILVVYRYDKENQCIKTSSDKNPEKNGILVIGNQFKYDGKRLWYKKYYCTCNSALFFPPKYRHYVEGKYEIAITSESTFSFVVKTDIQRLLRAMRDAMSKKLKEIEDKAIDDYLARIKDTLYAEIAECYTHEEGDCRKCHLTAENIVSSRTLEKEELQKYYYHIQGLLKDYYAQDSYDECQELSFKPLSFREFEASCIKEFESIRSTFDKDITFSGLEGDRSISTGIAHISIGSETYHFYLYSSRFTGFKLPWSQTHTVDEECAAKLESLIKDNLLSNDSFTYTYSRTFYNNAKIFLERLRVSRCIEKIEHLIVSEEMKSSTLVPSVLKDCNEIISFWEDHSHFSDDDSMFVHHSPKRRKDYLYIYNNHIVQVPGESSLSTYVYLIEPGKAACAIFLIIAYFSCGERNKREGLSFYLMHLFESFGILQMTRYETSLYLPYFIAGGM